MSKLIVYNLKKSFKQKEVLKKINFSLNEGDFLTVLGPSGCGKTTLLNCLAGSISIDSGQINYGTQEIKNNVALVQQDLLLFPHLNVARNIGFSLKMQGMKKQKITDKVNELLEIISLQGYGNKYPHELSGGEKQRVAIARAIIGGKKLLFLDEPFSKLNADLKMELGEFVKQLQKKLGIITIMVTHDQEEALRLGDKTLIILNGVAVAFGKTQDVFLTPVNFQVAKFLGYENIFNNKVIPYKAIIFKKDGSLKGEILNVMEGTKGEISYLIKCEEGTLVTKGYFAQTKQPGEEVNLEILEENCLYFNEGDQKC